MYIDQISIIITLLESYVQVPGMTLSQFDLISLSQNNYTYKRREGEFSVVQVSFNLQRHTGYFLIQVSSHFKASIKRMCFKFPMFLSVGIRSMSRVF